MKNHVMPSTFFTGETMNTIARIALLLLAFAGQAFAGNVLFVNYNNSDNTVPAALAADGHTVTSANVDPSTASNYFQNANVGQYCAVVWSTAYAYNQNVTGASATLSSYATSGGHVLITTPDGIRNNGGLVSLLGGSGGTDNGNAYSTVANVSNSLTTGLIDIRGQQPPPISDMDALCGPLGSGTVGLVTAQNTGCASEPGYAWSLRSLGSGQVAFITSGNFTSGNDPDWSNTAIPGDGVYNAGLRNYVYAACIPAPPVAVPTNSTFGIIFGSLILAACAAFSIRRHLG